MKPRPVAIVLVAVVAQALLVLMFVLPGHDPEPHDLPVAAPAQVAEDIQRTADRVQPGGFDIVPVADAAAAEQAILDRDAYGALLPQERQLLVASAASLPVSQLLATAFEDSEVRDVRPLDPDDPRGATLNLIGVPLIVVCLPVGLLLAGLQRRFAAAAGLAFALLAGLAVIAVLHGWIGALPGDYLALAGVAALMVGAVALPTIGLVRLLGPPGLGIVALVVFVIGNPANGAATAPEMLPGFWRAVGPFLPPGAGVAGLRNVAYFDGAALTRPLLVLAAFALGGLALIAATARARAHATARER
jgi:hypothetical protein